MLLALCGSAVSQPEPELVSVQSVDPTIVVELRYAGTRNLIQRPLYPANMPALVRPSVASGLATAQAHLRERGFRLKIWDAYRPQSAHEMLWQYAPHTDYVASPAEGGSLHTRGVAVDATLVDSKGRDVEMPTDFDDFRPAAWLYYHGKNTKVRRHLRTLQAAMARGGFYGMRTEWWHFVSKDWKDYAVIPEIKITPSGEMDEPAPLRAEPMALRAEPVSPSSPSSLNPNRDSFQQPSGGTPAGPLQRGRR